MTDKQKIKKEIERLKHNTPNAYDLSRFMLLEEIESFIDSLSEEPASEDLEEEIDRFEEWLNSYNQSDYPTSYTVRDIARHFAEWQRKKDQETIELAEEHAMLAGMEKMKEEMMKNAVEGVVVGRDRSTMPPFQTKCKIVVDRVSIDANENDKVKVIIIKSEQHE